MGVPMKPELFDEVMYHLERGEIFVDGEDVDDIRLFRLSCFGFECDKCKLYHIPSNGACTKARVEIYNYIVSNNLCPWLFL